MTSNNSFTKKNFNISSNSFADKSVATASGQFTTKVTSISANVWNGENLSGGVYGGSDEFGGPNSVFGTGEMGGIDHFRVKPQADVAH